MPGATLRPVFDRNTFRVFQPVSQRRCIKELFHHFLMLPINNCIDGMLESFFRFSMPACKFMHLVAGRYFFISSCFQIHSIDQPV